MHQLQVLKWKIDERLSSIPTFSQGQGQSFENQGQGEGRDLHFFPRSHSRPKTSCKNCSTRLHQTPHILVVRERSAHKGRLMPNLFSLLPQLGLWRENSTVFLAQFHNNRFWTLFGNRWFMLTKMRAIAEIFYLFDYFF